MTHGVDFLKLNPPHSPLKPLRAEVPALQQGLSFERSAAQQEAKVDQVAHDFEALLVKQIFASMRHTLSKEQNGFGEQMFTSMLDEQLASHVADSGGMGLADPLTQVLRGPVDGPPKQQEDDDVE